jgi:hypothetical protein
MQERIRLAKKPSLAQSAGLQLNWIYRGRERLEVELGVPFFNLMNLANYESPRHSAFRRAERSVNGTYGGQPNSTVLVWARKCSGSVLHV